MVPVMETAHRKPTLTGPLGWVVSFVAYGAMTLICLWLFGDGTPFFVALFVGTVLITVGLNWLHPSGRPGPLLRWIRRRRHPNQL
jgi:hypothetical protein